LVQYSPNWFHGEVSLVSNRYAQQKIILFTYQINIPLLLKTVNTPENQVDAAKRGCPMIGAKKKWFLPTS